MKNKWLFALSWINAAVAIVMLIQYVAYPVTNLHDLLHILAYSLVYANLTGMLGMVALGGLLEKLGRRLPLIPTMLVGIVTFTAIGCLLAQTLLMLIGFVVPQHFWREYFPRCVSACHSRLSSD